MTADFRLRDLAVMHLEYVFTPAGLPLVDKGDRQGGTTSILVRGTAGSGKTTLALALAHSIAKHHNGVVLCLSTEFSPAEVVFKAKVLGLPVGAVDAWPGRSDHAVGAVLVQSLSVLSAADNIDGTTSGSRKVAAFNAIHELLEAESGIPVRAIVLDALTLPDDNENGGELRERLLEMIQALEHRGISTVLVEESAPGASDWAAFVVDAVFELSMVADPETSELSRKLACPKSRYAFTQAGPHSYGLDNGKPAVWPNILRFISQAPELQVARLPLALPISQPEQWTLSTGGEIVLSLYDRTGTQLLRAIRGIPGAREFDVRCGAISRVGGVSGGLQVPDEEGPGSLGWAILGIALDRRANLCVINNLESLAQRQSWTVPLVHVLEALKAAGLLVVVHGEAAALAPVAPDALYVSGGRASAVRIPETRILNAERWLAMGHFSANNVARRDAWMSLRAELWNCSTLASLVNIGERAREYLLSNPTDAQVFHFHWNLLSGATEQAPGSAPNVVPMNAALLITAGRTWAASHAAFEDFKSSSPKSETRLVWNCVQALMVGNPSALDAIAKHHSTGKDPWVLGPLCRALAQAGRLAEADDLIAQACQQNDAPNWYLERFKAEIRISGGTDDSWREAKERLESLLAREAIPLIHQAEVEFNIAAVCELKGGIGEALRTYRQSLSTNSRLAPAKEAIERLAAEMGQEDFVPPAQEPEVPVS